MEIQEVQDTKPRGKHGECSKSRWNKTIDLVFIANVQSCAGGFRIAANAAITSYHRQFSGNIE
jgi:hypothetical protein